MSDRQAGRHPPTPCRSSSTQAPSQTIQSTISAGSRPPPLQPSDDGYRNGSKESLTQAHTHHPWSFSLGPRAAVTDARPSVVGEGNRRWVGCAPGGRPEATHHPSSRSPSSGSQLSLPSPSGFLRTPQNPSLRFSSNSNAWSTFLDRLASRLGSSPDAGLESP